MAEVTEFPDWSLWSSFEESNQITYQQAYKGYKSKCELMRSTTAKTVGGIESFKRKRGASDNRKNKGILETSFHGRQG